MNKIASRTFGLMLLLSSTAVFSGGMGGGIGPGGGGMGGGMGGGALPPGITVPPCVATRTCTVADIPLPPGVTLPPCVATRTCTPADLVGLLPPRP